jgi:hypothetical protein
MRARSNSTLALPYMARFNVFSLLHGIQVMLQCSGETLHRVNPCPTRCEVAT